MKRIRITQNIIPIGEFKTNLSRFVTRTRESGELFIITQNGRAAAVLLSPEEYDELIYTRTFMQSVAKGLEEADAGEAISTNKLKKQLEKRRAERR